MLRLVGFIRYSCSQWQALRMDPFASVAAFADMRLRRVAASPRACRHPTVASCGGLTADAADNIYIVRGSSSAKSERISVDVKVLADSTKAVPSVQLQNGDVIAVSKGRASFTSSAKCSLRTRYGGVQTESRSSVARAMARQRPSIASNLISLARTASFASKSASFGADPVGIG